VAVITPAPGKGSLVQCNGTTLKLTTWERTRTPGKLPYATTGMAADADGNYETPHAAGIMETVVVLEGIFDTALPFHGAPFNIRAGTTQSVPVRAGGGRAAHPGHQLRHRADDRRQPGGRARLLAGRTVAGDRRDGRLLHGLRNNGPLPGRVGGPLALPGKADGRRQAGVLRLAGPEAPGRRREDFAGYPAKFNAYADGLRARVWWVADRMSPTVWEWMYKSSRGAGSTPGYSWA
jgi:hypothetical protein